MSTDPIMEEAPWFPPEAETFQMQSRFTEEPPNELSWDPDSAPFDRLAEPEGVGLEIRGLISQPPATNPKAAARFRQSELWKKGTIYKNTIAAKLRAVGEWELSQKLEDCHSTYTVVQCCGCRKTRRFPNRCDLFYCPECAHHLSTERQKQVEWWAVRVRQPKHVVLTIKNIPDLTAGHVQEFKKYFARLRRRKFARGWKGGFYRIELTNQKTGWHLHLHALISAKWIDQNDLSDQWKSITNGLGYIVKVKDCRSAEYLHEVTKYVAKGHQIATWPSNKIVQFINAFDGLRTFGVFGELFGARTEFAEWIAGLKERRPKCECGCDRQIFYTEAQWILNDLLPDFQSKPRPPPQPIPTECEFWPNASRNWTPQRRD